jgi:hypothetical protein
LAIEIQAPFKTAVPSAGSENGNRFPEFPESFYQTERGISSKVLWAGQRPRAFKESKEAGFETGLLDEKRE